MYAARPPKLAMPVIVLAADPPLISTADPSAVVQAERAVGLDQRHRPLDELLADQERVVGLGDDVDQCVADADDVVAGAASAGLTRPRPPYPAASPATLARVSAPSVRPLRLPRTALPTRYDLVLEPDLATATFTGEVTIALDVVERRRASWCSTPTSSTCTRRPSTASRRRSASTRDAERLFVVPASPCSRARRPCT